MLPTLSAKENIRLCADLRLKATAAEKKAKVDSLLSKLDIFDERYCIVTKISGGQMRRVSIAMELITEPLCLVLDEPTRLVLHVLFRVIGIPFFSPQE
jgi:ABC-type multidrug transport system ATPase subunit